MSLSSRTIHQFSDAVALAMECAGISGSLEIHDQQGSWGSRYLWVGKSSDEDVAVTVSIAALPPKVDSNDAQKKTPPKGR